MSFLFGGKPQMSSAEKIANAEIEVEMISEMFNRIQQSCAAKCVPPEYRESELNKGESVCLDRCVSKFFEVNIKVGEKMQAEAGAKQGGAGGIFGM